MYYKTASLILNSEQKNGSSSDIFIAQPDAKKENLAGKLFVLVEINSDKNEAARIAELIINSLSRNYYQEDERSFNEEEGGIGAEGVFQKSLSKTNKELSAFLEKEKIKISPYAFNATAALICGEDLHFSSLGKNRNFLIYKEKAETGKKQKAEETNYKITELGNEQGQTSRATNLNKLFSDLTSGRIPAGGYFIMGNEAFYEYISTKQLIDISTKLSPAGAAEQIKNILSRINARTPFLGIIIKNSTNERTEREDIRKEMEEKSKKYINEIEATEQKTEDIMAPSGIINLKGIKRGKTQEKKPKNKINKALLGNLNSLRGHISFKKRKSAAKKTLLKTLGWIGLLFKLILLAVKKMADKKTLALLATKTRKLPAKLGKSISKKESEGGMKRKNKIILASCLLLFAILSANLVITAKDRKSAAEKKAFLSLVEEIEKKQNKIEANLLYGNKKKAAEISKENEKKLRKLSEENDDLYNKYRERIIELSKKQKDQVEKIRKVIKVENFKKIADFSNLNDKAAPRNIIIYNNAVYLGDPRQESIYKADLSENINTANNRLPEDIKSLDYPTISGNGINYLNGDDILEIKREGRADKASNIPIKLPEGDTVISMGSFNNNLYLLGREQIYRYIRAAKGFSAPFEWLKEEDDLSRVADIAIDGNIYLLKTDGSVNKFLKGKQQEFKTETLYEPIENANKIIASSELEYIYIFEPGKKRLAVFDKKGSFAGQYIFNMENIEDLDISEKNAMIYILKEASVYRAELSHTD